VIRPRAPHLAALFSLAALAACDRADPSPQATPPAAVAPDPLPALRAFDAERRAKIDFAALPPSDHRLGPDPYAIAPLPGSDRFVALLRGRDAVVVLDAALHELSRLPAPGSPTGLAVDPESQHVWITGERESSIARYAVQDRAPFLVRDGSLPLPDVHALRDVTAGPGGVLYAVEEHDGRLLVLWPEKTRAASAETILSARRTDIPIGRAPFRVARIGSYLVVDDLLTHALSIRTVDAQGAPLPDSEARITHDGPIWSFDALRDGDALIVAAAGVEDRPLDRRGGFFGYVDSFVFLYRVEQGKATRIGEVNTSSLGVVTPKALSLTRSEGGAFEVLVTGYGGERMARIVFGKDPAAPVQTTTRDLLPGTRAIADLGGGGFVAANPLIDAFVRVPPGDGPAEIVPVADPAAEPARSTESRLGEALFFTGLMAPWNPTEGAHSRFTCETCHFEGYVDGRIHHTGRGEVRVVTKPLLGLFNNRPHFSRALDPDLASVAHNEFRVAGAESGHDPWFSLEAREHPILPALGIREPALDPLALRRALMAFLIDFTHRTNPAVAYRSTFTPLEREGAALFRDRCESCHEARLSADDPATRAPFERWESLVLSPGGPLVWAIGEYRKTGVVPYVHERGARVPSLRRLYKKRPYLTSGKAGDLPALLTMARWAPDGAFYHDGAPAEATGLGEQERVALQAFLDLL
jgi:hypothetical protein